MRTQTYVIWTLIVSLLLLLQLVEIRTALGTPIIEWMTNEELYDLLKEDDDADFVFDDSDVDYIGDWLRTEKEPDATISQKKSTF